MVALVLLCSFQLPLALMMQRYRGRPAQQNNPSGAARETFLQLSFFSSLISFCDLWWSLSMLSRAVSWVDMDVRIHNMLCLCHCVFIHICSKNSHEHVALTKWNCPDSISFSNLAIHHAEEKRSCFFLPMLVSAFITCVNAVIKWMHVSWCWCFIVW